MKRFSYWHARRTVTSFLNTELQVRILWRYLPRIIGVIAIGLGFIHYSTLPSLPVPWLIDLHNDLAPELIGMGLTVIVIEWALRLQSREERKAQLIRQLRSRHPDVAEMALIELEHEGWLIDGSLVGASLEGAVLSGANLGRANLSGANLWSADLSKADLRGVNLSRATLLQANLSGANLGEADLSETSLWSADLSHAYLWSANLSGALLLSANLSGADLSKADLSGASLLGANLNQARLSGTQMDSDLVISPELWKTIKTDCRTLRWSRK